MYYNKYNWVNTTSLAAISLEQFFTSNLFKNDLNKAVYATADYAYRRRFELLDTSRDFESVEASSLQFPFMSYHIDENWKPIVSKRIFSLEEVGAESGSGLANLRMIQVENKINILLHFDREDDARMAYDKLSFMSSNKRWFTQQVSYQADNLDIPFKFIIDPTKITFSPKVQENDWLKQNRLFILSLDVQVESMILFPPDQTEDGENFSPEPFVISEEVIMEFTSGKNPVITSVSDVILEDNSITLSSYVLERATKTTAKLSWDFIEQSEFTEVYLEVNGKTYDLPLEDHIITIRGLLSGANYTADLYAVRNDSSKHFTLSFSTTSSATSSTDIIGTTW